MSHQVTAQNAHPSTVLRGHPEEFWRTPHGLHPIKVDESVLRFHKVIACHTLPIEEQIKLCEQRITLQKERIADIAKHRPKALPKIQEEVMEVIAQERDRISRLTGLKERTVDSTTVLSVNTPEGYSMVATFPEKTTAAFDIDAAIARVKNQIIDVNPDQYVGPNGGKGSSDYKSAVVKVSTLRKTCKILESMKAMLPGTYVRHSDYGLGEVKSHELDDRGIPMTLVAFEHFELGEPVPTGKLSIPELPSNIKKLILKQLNEEWQSDIAIAAALSLPLVEVKKELAALASDKKAHLNSDGLRWKAVSPESTEPITPHVLVIKEREGAYKTPKVIRAKTLYSTGSTVRVDLGKEHLGKKQKNLLKGKVYCLDTEEDFLNFLELVQEFQSSLDNLRSAATALGRYDLKLKSAGGYKAAPNPLTSTVVLTSDPTDEAKSFWLYGWKVPSIERLEISRHTPQMMKLLQGDKDYGLVSQESGLCCPSDEDWEQVSTLHEKARFAGEEIEKLLETLQTYEQKEKERQELGDSKPQDTEITLNTNSGSATQDEITQNDIGGATESKEDSVQPKDDAVQLEALTERVHALLKPEKRSLISIAEEVGEDRTEVTKALYALREEGRAVQAPESFGIFWSLPAPSVTQPKDRLEWKVGSRFENVLVCNDKFEPSKEETQLLWLNPDDIIIDAGTQSRPKEDQDKIDDYKRDMDAGEWDYHRLPLPVVALYENRYYAVDCHHRVEAGRASSGCDRLYVEVRKATLAQARLWSAKANTQHGLAANNSPAGVRKRVEMALDNLELLTPEQYLAELETVPDLTPTERKLGKFSDRILTRYLRLRPTQNRTVGNIRKEREFAAQFAQLGLEEGMSRVEVVAENSDRPIGSMGLVMQLDRKSGVWVKWDSDGRVWAIHPGLVNKTDKPKPLATVPNREVDPPAIEAVPVKSVAQCFTPSDKTDSVLPDVTPETPDKGTSASVTPYQEQTSTTPAEYAKAEASLAVSDAIANLAKLTPEQWSEVLESVAKMGVSDRHFKEAIKASEGILLVRTPFFNASAS